jgi:putative membrane protein
MRLVIFAATIMVMALGASTQQQFPKQPQQRERTITAEPSDNNTVKGIDDTDLNFMQKAAINDEAEIRLGQMAQERAANADVKSFAERMVKDHSRADGRLKTIAQSQHISLPTSLDPSHQHQAAALSKLSGPQFDKEYMLYMVQAHTKAVNKFKQESANAHDGIIKQFAAATLPVLKSHLNEAKEVQQKIASERF